MHGEIQIREILAHCGKKKQSNNIIIEISKALLKDPSLRLILSDYLYIFKNSDWKSFDPGTLLLPLEALPSQRTNSKKASFSKIWPVSLGVMFIKKGFGIEFESEGGSDLFVFEQDVEHFMPLSVETHNNSLFKGIAIQCKSITSAKQIDKNIKKAAQQLKSSEGGLIALDISSLMYEYYSKNYNGNFDLDAAVKVIREGFGYLSARCIKVFGNLRDDPYKYCAGIFIYSQLIIDSNIDNVSNMDAKEMIIPCAHLRWNVDYSNSIVSRLGEEHSLHLLFDDFMKVVPKGELYVNNSDLLTKEDPTTNSISITTIGPA